MLLYFCYEERDTLFIYYSIEANLHTKLQIPPGFAEHKAQRKLQI